MSIIKFIDRYRKKKGQATIRSQVDAWCWYYGGYHDEIPSKVVGFFCFEVPE